MHEKKPRKIYPELFPCDDLQEHWGSIGLSLGE